MAICNSCGSELKWVGSMRDGKLDCSFCRIFDNLPELPQAQYENVAPMMFRRVPNQSEPCVECPACGYEHTLASIRRVGANVQCGDCGLWAEVEP